MSAELPALTPSHRGMYTQFGALFRAVGTTWNQDEQPLNNAPGSVEIFTEALKLATDEIFNQLHPRLQIIAVQAGARVTASYAHTMAHLAQQHGMDRLESPHDLGTKIRSEC